jgi:hypothetical protein
MSLTEDCGAGTSRERSIVDGDCRVRELAVVRVTGGRQVRCTDGKATCTSVAFTTIIRARVRARRTGQWRRLTVAERIGPPNGAVRCGPHR